MKEQLLQEVKSVIAEATKVNYKGHTFVLRVDVNEDPNKKGVKVNSFLLPLEASLLQSRMTLLWLWVRSLMPD